MNTFIEKFKQFFRQAWDRFVLFWKRRHLTQILLLTALVAILLSILWFAFMASQANVQSLKDGLGQSTMVYDKDGDEAGSVATRKNAGIPFDEMPKQVPNAVVAIEDERFYEHNGFDIIGITRAFFGNLFAGRITGGGSTITQQLTKNALLSSERTYKRKVEELFLAVEIEKVYEKDEILEMYLNQVYFGSGAWGIGNASKKYFNKDLRDVTISEAALLAGLLKAPSSLDPYKNYDGAITRRNLVLDKMKELGMITADEHAEAKTEKIKLEDGGGSLVDRKYPYYMDAVMDEAIKRYGLTQEELLTRGYVIHTALDQNLQSSLEKVYKRNSNFPAGRGGEIVQSGAVMLDPSSGGVRALVGGRGEQVFRGFNRATHLAAQPGSTMKPLAVYAPALDEGYSYDSMLKDEKMEFGNYAPQNLSREYKGEVPMYEAVEDSINLPAVWLLNEIGLEKGIQSAEKFGIPIEEEDKNLAIALGGMHNGVSPLQMASAYSTFANGGKRADSHLITKIVGPTGNVIAEHKTKETRVMSSGAAEEMTSMLLNVVESGTGRAAKIEGLEIAGKTGSTQLPFDDINGTKDQWFAGYTPTLAAAVWLGYDTTDREHYLPASSSNTVVPLFREIMEAAAPYLEEKKFDVESANERLEGGLFKGKLKETAKEIAEKVEEKIKEEAPKWQEAIDKAKEGAANLGEKLKDGLNGIFQ